MSPPTGEGLTAGELWAREQLDALRTARFRPRSLGAFLVASQRRAGEVRRARPELARQARAWIGAGAGAWIGLAAAGREPFRGHLASGLGWWTAVAVMLDWHLGMVETEAGEPRPLGPADALTLSRAWLVPAVAAGERPGLLLAAGATDALDGIVARSTRPTRAGRDLEGLADAAVVAAALTASLRTNGLPRSVIALELARTGAGFIYACTAYFARAEAPNREVTGAARLLAPLRLGGLVAAAGGRRRLGSALLGAGSLASLAALAEATRS